LRVQQPSPENAEKLAAAVAQLQASAPTPRKELSIEQRRLDRQAGKLDGVLRAPILIAASILGATRQSMEQRERELGRIG
jgi:hypothetical protein